MELSKMSMDRAIAAEDQRSRYSRMILKTFLNAYFNAAASEAIDNLGRHVRVKQRGCGHEEEDLCGTAALGCAEDFLARSLGQLLLFISA
jgi:hypothetical protein